MDNGGRGRADDAWELVLDNDRVAAQIDEPWAQIMSTLVRGMAYCQVDPQAALVHLGRGAEMADRCGMSLYATVAAALAGLAGKHSNTQAPLEDDPARADRRAPVRDRVPDPARTRGVAHTLTELGRPDRAAIFAGAAPSRRSRSATDAGTRTYQIDRDDHRDHVAMFDLGGTMDVPELLALSIAGWPGTRPTDQRSVV